MFNRRRRAGVACVLVAVALGPALSIAADPPTAPSKDDAKRVSKADDADAVVEVDDELLEFLGSVDSEDGELIDYYAKTAGSRREGIRSEDSQKTTRNHE